MPLPTSQQQQPQPCVVDRLALIGGAPVPAAHDRLRAFVVVAILLVVATRWKWKLVHRTLLAQRYLASPDYLVIYLR